MKIRAGKTGLLLVSLLVWGCHSVVSPTIVDTSRVVARLHWQGEPFCQAVAVAPHELLTAAHCIPPHYRLRPFAVAVPGTGGAWQELVPVEVVVHPDFVPATFSRPSPLEHDVAVIRVAETLKHYLPLAEQQVLPLSRWEKQELLLWACGPMEEQPGLPMTLSGPVKTFPGKPGEMRIEVATCPGQSGGPLVGRPESGNWALLGVVSSGSRHGGETRVTLLTPWRHWLNALIAR